MSDQTNVIGQTVAQTAEVMAPTILAAAASAASPQLATIAALAPVAVQFLQSATALQQAGVLPPDQLANLFRTIGQGIQSTHDRWAALNAAAVKA